MIFFNKRRKIKNIMVLAVAILIPQIAGFLGSIYTTPNIKTWYEFINKPTFNPPNWVFAPVWAVLFVLMGIASYIVYKQNNKNTPYALKMYLAQLIFNIMWSIVFFGMKSPLGAFFIIALLWYLIGRTMLYFYQIKKIAGILFVPYFLWVTFAAVLNFAIYILNYR